VTAVELVSIETVEATMGTREHLTLQCTADPTHPEHGQWRMPGETPPLRPCPWCRMNRDAKTRRRRRAVRSPPRPPHEKAPNTCSLCGTTPLPGRRQSWCSDECVNRWMAATGSRDHAVKILIEIHGAVCAECGAERLAVELDVDHTRPLWSLTDDERLDLSWWMPETNLQLLCHDPCHKAKTKREAAERAKARRRG
jgi:hypothetical protein